MKRWTRVAFVLVCGVGTALTTGDADAASGVALVVGGWLLKGGET